MENNAVPVIENKETPVAGKASWSMHENKPLTKKEKYDKATQSRFNAPVPENPSFRYRLANSWRNMVKNVGLVAIAFASVALAVEGAVSRNMLAGIAPHFSFSATQLVILFVALAFIIIGVAAFSLRSMQNDDTTVVKSYTSRWVGTIFLLLGIVIAVSLCTFIFLI